jgi:hypothetical protein
VEKLNAQELRHSQYFGEFVTTVEKLSSDKFWDQIQFFTRRDSQRMKDIEFVSELFVIVIDGIQDQQKTLDKFYSDYDVVFPKKTHHIAKFHQVLASLRTLTDLFTKTRFTKKADFYAIFAATTNVNANTQRPVNLITVKGSLKKLNRELNKRPGELTGVAASYYSTVIEGPNKLAKRKERATIIEDILKQAIK